MFHACVAVGIGNARGFPGQGLVLVDRERPIGCQKAYSPRGVPLGP